MSGIFGNLTTEGLEETKDRLGGSFVRDSDAYLGTIKAAYVGQSASSKARSVTIIADLAATDTHQGGEYRETFWVTNKDDVNYYVDKDKKKQQLAGFTIVDDICGVTVGKGLAQMATEEKVINIYNYDEKKEIPTSVPMLVELIGQQATFAILKKMQNKQAKNSTTGAYEDTADTREINETDKIFHVPSNLTMVEARNKIQKPGFYAAWVERNRGKTRDNRSIKDGVGNGQAGRPGRPNGAPPKAGDTAVKTAPLFGPN
jgi:hypothetical protein